MSPMNHRLLRPRRRAAGSQYLLTQDGERLLTEADEELMTDDGATQYLLDQFGAAAAAYSLRRLSSAYTGPAVQVRRSSDNAEETFTPEQIADGSLAAWVGGGNSGFVKTWYDQSGNGKDASQSVSTDQPRIVSGGSISTENGKPSIEFISADVLSTTHVLSAAFGILFVGRYDNIEPQSSVGTTYLTSLAAGNYVLGRYTAGAGTPIGVRLRGTGLSDVILDDSISQHIALFWADGAGNARGSLNNGAVQENNSFSTSFTNSSIIGGTGGGRLFSGVLQELVFWGSDKGQSASGIATNANTYYNTY